MKVSGCLWLCSLVVCSPLFYAYTTVPRPSAVTNVTNVVVAVVAIDNGTFAGGDAGTECGTYYWSDTAGIVYFTVHGALVYLVPIVIMFFTHLKIAEALRRTNRPTSGISSANRPTSGISSSAVSRNSDIANDTVSGSHTNIADNSYSAAVLQREADKAMKSKAKKVKIINLLVAITVTFIVLWTPFIVTRIVSKVGTVSNVTWSIVQVLVLLSTTTNFFITLKMSPEFKKTVRSFLPCYLTPKCADVAGGGYSAPLSANTTPAPSRSAIYQDMSTEI